MMARGNPVNRLAVMSAMSLLAGCASGASAKGMTVTPADIKSPPNPALARALEVGEVSGGSETNPLWSSNIDNQAFQAALADSLRVAGLLAEGAAARFRLRATLVRLDKPFLGFDMTVTTVVRYELADVKSGASVFGEEITAAHTATMGDAFMGVERLRLANEGSARKNIAALIERLSALSVPAATVSMR